MSIELDALKQAALRMSPADRAELAQFLIESLDPDIEDVDEVEVERRAGEIDRGEVTPIPGDEALAHVRRQLRQVPPNGHKVDQSTL